MTCRWCGNENVLNRPVCPHCGEDVKRLEQAFGPPPPDRTVEAPFEGVPRSAAAQVGMSFAVSALAVLMLVGGGRLAQSQWPPWVWPRSVPAEAEAATGEGPGPGISSSESAEPDAGCVQRGGSVTDHRGETFDPWYCTVERPGAVYSEPDPTAAVVGDLQETESWFVCQVEGAAADDGGTTWLYTQGDEQYADEGWGYFPASRIDSAWVSGPVPDVPPCSF